MQIKSIGIIGYGSFGAFLAVLIERFAPTVQIRVHSSRYPVDGKRFFTLKDTCVTDALILAVPIHSIETVLLKILPHTSESTIIVDVATVKVYTAALLKKLARDRRYIATHPMFGPQSYEKRNKNIQGFRIVVTENTLEQKEYAQLVSLLRKIGFDVVEMTSARHDQHLAETLFLTHFIGQMIHRGGFERTDIDSVSFGFLMNAVDSVRNDTALFQDVFKFNPYCEQVLKRLEKAESDTHALLKKKAGD
jgi:prephenate dehydrogenase